ncbi:unnamed protein product [Didymodactylos carnosus]|uniref:Uncharacterized protein n=1 Tax=Didymodactylos carnosus TaxID=1234261 RepID=A0A8S2PM21_9BILA|nr:unnamed protein product [Didymodactylos carnosus]CAF4058203.1 unnamed protein product [Didymodactylos carnosus]
MQLERTISNVTKINPSHNQPSKRFQTQRQTSSSITLSNTCLQKRSLSNIRQSITRCSRSTTVKLAVKKNITKEVQIIEPKELVKNSSAKPQERKRKTSTVPAHDEQQVSKQKRQKTIIDDLTFLKQ